MEAYANVLTIAIVFFTVLIVIEFLASHIMGKQVYRAMDTISSLSSGLTNNIKSIFKLSVIIISYDWMYSHLAQFNIQSTWLVYLIGFIGIDFASYWSHRWNHEINLFWNRHIIHHSSEEYNLACALRQSISGIVQIYFFLYIPMAIIGVPPDVINIIAPLHLFAQFWYHTRLIGKMGFLEHIIMTPSHHRVHHAINKEYIDKNYSAIFIFWDKWFGTFQEELPDVPPVYGVKKAVRTWNPMLINFQHVWQITKDAWYTKNWKDKARVWFMPTGWRPEDVKVKFPVDYVENANEQVKFDTPTTTGLTIWSFFQLNLHLLMQIHMIMLLPSMSYVDLLLYGIFITVSIFAYSALMDRHWVAVPAEMVKLACGFGLLYYLGDWYQLQQFFSYTIYLVAGYFIISAIVTSYYTFNKSTEKVKLEMA